MECRKSTNLFVKGDRQQQITLTVNRRLASVLHKYYDQEQITLGKKSWPRPHILPIHNWFATIWQQLEIKPIRLLSDFEEQCLWQEIIKSSQSLIQLHNTAKLAKQAWQLLNHWEISLDAISSTYNEEVDLFLNWAKQFRRICSEKNWISNAVIPKRLISMIDELRPYLPDQIVLSGFDELNPIYQSFFSHLKTYCEVISIDLITPYKSIQRIQLDDEETEILMMARWAKQLHIENPGWQIGCIVPELQHLRTKIEKKFIEIFSIEKILPVNFTNKEAFNISAGQNLLQYPLIKAIYFAIQCANGTFDIESSSEFLQSPYFALTPEDMSVGALLNAKLRELPKQTFSLSCLFQPLQECLNHFPRTTWLRRLRNYRQIQNQLPQQALPSEWVEHFISLITALGFPGFRSVNSSEYQLIQRWQYLLSEFSGLDFLQPMNLTTALNYLYQLLQHTIFQPQSSNPSIQILGVLEAVGCQFDAIWVMGLHDIAWPPAAKPNPLLPFSLQVQFGMPHVNNNRELIYAKQITKRLQQSAKHVIFSSPQQQNDRQLRPSKLIQDIPEITTGKIAFADYLPYTEIIYNTRRTEQLLDNIAPALTKDENVYGGSWILKEQSACPFRAFANIRLQAQSLAEPILGISPAQRGTLLHRCLAKIWHIIQSQQKLQQFSAKALHDQVAKAVNNVIEKATADETFCNSQAILKLEKQRLIKLLLNWLAIEKQRHPFVVIQQEAAQSMQINKLTLNLRIDRIDQLTDGSHIIIDYKTGITSINDWFGNRPKEPQLPLYCIASDTQNILSGVAFAEIRGKNMKFKGISKETLTKNKVSSGIIPINHLKNETHLSWQALIENWKSILTRLADEFCQGNSQVAPRDSITCQYCELQPLCRINSSE